MAITGVATRGAMKRLVGFRIVHANRQRGIGRTATRYTDRESYCHAGSQSRCGKFLTNYLRHLFDPPSGLMVTNKYTDDKSKIRFTPRSSGPVQSEFTSVKFS